MNADLLWISEPLLAEPGDLMPDAAGVADVTGLHLVLWSLRSSVDGTQGVLVPEAGVKTWPYRYASSCWRPM